MGDFFLFSKKPKQKHCRIYFPSHAASFIFLIISVIIISFFFFAFQCITYVDKFDYSISFWFFFRTL